MQRLLIAVANLPPCGGGAEQVAWGLGNSLANTYEVHILATKGGYLSNTVTLHLVPRYPLMTITYSTILRQVISTRVSGISPAIIHSHITLPFGYIFQSVKQMKTVITVSGSDVFPRKDYPERFFVLSALRGSSAVVSPSKWLARYLEENYQVHPVVIPNGVDTRIFRPHTDLSRSNVVLFVGRFIKLKGILELLEAARELPQYEFWLAGRGPLKIPKLPNVKVLGFYRNTAQLYPKASLCVFPSHYENFPTVGLEAMACGKALVATERGFSEYVENGKDGILVKPHDVRSLVDAIRYLMENERTRKGLERNARNKATQYDWTAIAGKYAKLYDSL